MREDFLSGKERFHYSVTDVLKKVVSPVSVFPLFVRRLEVGH